MGYDPPIWVPAAGAIIAIKLLAYPPIVTPGKGLTRPAQIALAVLCLIGALASGMVLLID